MTDQENQKTKPTPTLTGKQARYLRGLGHGLKPVVQVGKHGLGENLTHQVEECLLAHELIKIKVLETSPNNRDEVAQALAEATGGSIAQKVGRTILLYRAHPEDPWVKLPPAN